MVGPRARNGILAVLAGRKAWAVVLVGAMEKGTIDHREVPAHLARQIAEFKDSDLKNRIEKAWGSIQPVTGDRKAMVEKWRKQLTPVEISKGDAARGKALFARNCAACHRMFGEGGNLGPDLTGGQRGELRYWLENIIDPSAVVGREHQRTVVETKDGRVVAGVVKQETPAHLVLRSAEGEFTVPLTSIETRVATGKSIMPDGLLDGLKPGEPADLMAYLMSRLSK
jgi:putative heme-binding domain-containing protein